jgi:hypothetical protein
MTALQEALSLYGAEEFSKLQRFYTMHGFTFTGPDYIAFIRPCREREPEAFVDDGHDAWFVELVVGRGRIGQLLEMLPYPLPRIGWRRGFKGKHHIRFYDLSKLQSRT